LAAQTQATNALHAGCAAVICVWQLLLTQLVHALLSDDVYALQVLLVLFPEPEESEFEQFANAT